MSKLTRNNLLLPKINSVSLFALMTYRLLGWNICEHKNSATESEQSNLRWTASIKLFIRCEKGRYSRARMWRKISNSTWSWQSCFISDSNDEGHGANMRTDSGGSVMLNWIAMCPMDDGPETEVKTADRRKINWITIVLVKSSCSNAKKTLISQDKMFGVGETISTNCALILYLIPRAIRAKYSRNFHTN